MMTTEPLIAITNGRVFSGDQFLQDAAVLIKGSRVVGLPKTAEVRADTVVDAAGAYVVPGFIDLQVYGGGGHLFSESPSASVMNAIATRSEEHTSELQSRENLVCRLLLEKNKTDSGERQFRLSGV